MKITHIRERLKLLVTSLALVVMVPLATAPAAYALVAPSHVADSVSDACSGIGLSGTNCKNNGSGLTDVVKALINILSAVVGVAAVIMIIIGGFRYITSGGDSNKVASAKNTLIYAIVGLIIVALARVIVHFVLSKAG